MIALLLLAQLAAPVEVTPDCQTFFYVRLTWETAPGVWQTGALGNLKPTREEATVYRDEILERGYTVGPLMEGWSDLFHIAPGAVKAAPVRRVCCRQEGPIETWFCLYPDGE